MTMSFRLFFYFPGAKCRLDSVITTIGYISSQIFSLIQYLISLKCFSGIMITQSAKLWFIQRWLSLDTFPYDETTTTCESLSIHGSSMYYYGWFSTCS
ncbi:hypothetical protein YC2023_114531 [Brassica napus]